MHPVITKQCIYFVFLIVGFQRDSIPLVGFGATPHFGSIGDTAFPAKQKGADCFVSALSGSMDQYVLRAIASRSMTV